MRLRIPHQFLNPVALFGLFVVLAASFIGFVYLLIDVFEDQFPRYQGIFTLLVIPAFLTIGAAFVLLGILLERMRQRTSEAGAAAGKGEASRPRRFSRRTAYGTVLFGILLICVSIVAGAKAYDFTESPEFCGATCHEPMEPEYTAYQNGPHAHVLCVECHVGAGFENYARAKVSGLIQVYQVARNSFDRPIRAVPSHMLDADEACEHCHWPDKFLGLQLDTLVHFGYDAANTRRSLHFLLKTGGGAKYASEKQGIHWHTDEKNLVRYRTPDPLREEIPWVEHVRPDGTTVIYRDPEASTSLAELEQLPKIDVDCLTCHNRPAHDFPSPDVVVDRALELGEVDPTLPFIKRVAVRALAEEYTDRHNASDGIEQAVRAFYRERFPGMLQRRGDAIDQSIRALQDAYRRNIFPEMGVNWDTYPNHIGHRESPGCFRCHSGRHVDDQGNTIKHTCDTCHSFVLDEGPQEDGVVRAITDPSVFHPWTGHDHDNTPCWKCHSGSDTPYRGCGECHEKVTMRHSMTFECSMCHQPGGFQPDGTVCAACHPMGSSPQHLVAQHDKCLDCHTEHEWHVDEPRACDACHEDAKAVACLEAGPERPCSSCHDFKSVEKTIYGLDYQKP